MSQWRWTPLSHLYVRLTRNKNIEPREVVAVYLYLSSWVSPVHLLRFSFPQWFDRFQLIRGDRDRPFDNASPTPSPHPLPICQCSWVMRCMISVAWSLIASLNVSRQAVNKLWWLLAGLVLLFAPHSSSEGGGGGGEGTMKSGGVVALERPSIHTLTHTQHTYRRLLYRGCGRRRTGGGLFFLSWQLCTMGFRLQSAEY